MSWYETIADAEGFLLRVSVVLLGLREDVAAVEAEWVAANASTVHDAAHGGKPDPVPSEGGIIEYRNHLIVTDRLDEVARHVGFLHGAAEVPGRYVMVLPARSEADHARNHAVLDYLATLERAESGTSAGSAN
jgi:hypothetical protein